MPNTKMKFSSIPFYLVLFTISLNFLLTSATFYHKHFSAKHAALPKVHIIYTERPRNERPEAYHIRILTPVLGSEKAAKEALLYSFKNSISGFAAKLTPAEAEKISKQPGVLHVARSVSYGLQSRGNGLT